MKVRIPFSWKALSWLVFKAPFSWVYQCCVDGSTEVNSPAIPSLNLIKPPP